MTVPSAKDARLLGDQLHQDPVKYANNAAKLLACLQDPIQEPAARAAIQALKVFYIAQHDDGRISSKRQKLDPSAAAAAAADAPEQQQQQQQQQTPEELFASWLSRQYSSFITALIGLLNRATSASLQVAAAAAVMECVRHEAGPAVFSIRLYAQLLTTLTNSSNAQPEVISLLVSKYLPFWDVRYYTLKIVTKLAQQHAVRGSAAAAAAEGAAAAEDSDDEAVDPQQQQQGSGQRSSSDVSRAIFDVLSHVAAVVPPPPAADKQQQQQQQELDIQSWCGSAEAGLVTAAADAAVSAKARRKRKQQEAEQPTAATAVAWANAKVQQRVFGDAWLAFLRTDLPADIYRKVLIKLHSDVLPAMTNPLLLSDFLTHALDHGGFEGMLALNGIFRLVTKHGLEYPGFYARLYALITPAAFLHKHRVQFFQLADIFLASGMVPAYTAAAFAKKMARLALKAPPAGAMIAIGFIHNVIRRHPACMAMLHKPQTATAAANGTAADTNGTTAAAGGQGVDVYDENETDPAKSRAVESSLWELAALRNHYCPQVANMCSVLDKDLSDRIRTSELDIQPLLPTSYSSLMAQELGKKLRKSVPVAFYRIMPTGLWDQGLVGEDLQGWDLTVTSSD